VLTNQTHTHARSAGIPIIIVVTKSDRIDSVGDEMIQKGLISGKGIGGGGERGWAWDERVDWVQQMLRCVALKCESSGVSLARFARRRED
jgi:hypothetical protein